MKRTKLFLGTIAIVAIAGGLYVSNNVETVSERSYYTEELSTERTKEQAWSQANEYLNSLYVNTLTGKVEPADYDAAYQQALTMNNQKAAAFTFEEDGPDNIGGRTRAIIVDPNDDFTIYAGSVDGGMYKSVNGGNNWNRLRGWDTDVTTMSVSTVCMTNNGTIYVGTGGGGILGEGSLSGESSGIQSGDGIWYSVDEGASFTQLSGTENKEITRVAADLSADDVFYYTGSSIGLKKVTSKGTPVSATGITATLSCAGVSVSVDGRVVICAGAGKVYVSRDSGATFVNCMGGSSAVTTPILSGGSRMENAVAYDLNENDLYNLYLAKESGGKIHSIWYSEDEGENWYEIAPASTFGWEPCVSLSGQCYYDMVIDAVPGHPDHCLFGGIDLWRWRKTQGTTAADADGQWGRISNWAANTNSPNYVHADNHRFTWDSNGALYVGNDGGMSKSFDNTTSFFTVINKGYNATQFYGIGYGPNGEVIGGAQDNGTKYNDHSSASGKSYSNAGGGDGFECEISFLSGGEALLRTVYSGYLGRSDSKGDNEQNASAPGAENGFYNAIRLFEDDNDMDTQDSIEFIPDSSMSIGETVQYYSESFSLPLTYVLTQNLTVLWESVTPALDSVLPNFDTIPGGVPYLFNPIAQDTIMLPDTKQSLFVTYGDAIYITRDMLHFASGIEWWATDVTGSAQSYEFSKDGNTLWIGSAGGKLTKITHLDSAYTMAAADVSNKPVTGDSIVNLATGDTITTGFYDLDYGAVGYQWLDSTDVTYKLFTKTVVASGAIISDIATSAADFDDVLYCTGTSGGNVYLSTNANTSSPTFTNRGGNLPNYPVFGCEFIMNPGGDDIAMVGTEFGAYSNDNILTGSTWTAHTDETGIIPIFDVRQQWRDFDQGAKNPYEVFLGTFGRGIWTSDSYVGAGEHQVIDDVEGISGISIFPNPLSVEGNVAFELGNRSNVEFKVYDLQGKIINQVVWSNMNSGKHNMSFNVDKLPSGTYLVTLKAGTSTEVTKFIKY